MRRSRALNSSLPSGSCLPKNSTQEHPVVPRRSDELLVVEHELSCRAVGEYETPLGMDGIADGGLVLVAVRQHGHPIREFVPHVRVTAEVTSETITLGCPQGGFRLGTDIHAGHDGLFGR